MAGARDRARQDRSKHQRAAPAVAAGAAPTVQALWVPSTLTAGLLLLSFLPRIQQNTILTRSFWPAVGALLLWQAVLWVRGTFKRRPTLLLVGPRPQHYVQAMCQLSVYAYWGWY